MGEKLKEKKIAVNIKSAISKVYNGVKAKIEQPVGLKPCKVFLFLLLKPAYEPSGLSGQSLSQFPQHEATRSISTPPLTGWEASPSQGHPQH